MDSTVPDLPRGLAFLLSLEEHSVFGAMQDIATANKLITGNALGCTRELEKLMKFPLAKALRNQVEEQLAELREIIDAQEEERNPETDRTMSEVRADLNKLNGMVFLLRALVEIAECREPLEDAE